MPFFTVAQTPFMNAESLVRFFSHDRFGTPDGGDSRNATPDKGKFQTFLADFLGRLSSRPIVPPPDLPRAKIDQGSHPIGLTCHSGTARSIAPVPMRPVNPAEPLSRTKACPGRASG